MPSQMNQNSYKEYKTDFTVYGSRAGMDPLHAPINCRNNG